MPAKTTRISVLGCSSRSRVTRMSHSSEKKTLHPKRRVLFWAPIACANSRPPASSGRKSRSRRAIANLCDRRCRLCSPLAIPTEARPFGSWTTPPRVSPIGSKSDSVGRGTPSGMTASRRSISTSSFPALWMGGIHRPARRCRGRHSRRTKSNRLSKWPKRLEPALARRYCIRWGDAMGRGLTRRKGFVLLR